MPRYAVVTVAFGDATARAARLMLASLAAHAWEHEIHVLTDAQRDWPVPVTEHIVGPRVLNLDPEAPSQFAEIDIRDFPSRRAGDALGRLMPILHRWLGTDDYDQVLKLDADIVVNAPLEPVAAELARRGAPLSVGVSAGRLRRTPRSLAHLTPLERLRWRHATCLNAGFFAYPGSRAAMRILRAWEAQAMLPEAGDQAALQAIYLRRFRSEIAVLDRSFQDFGPMPKRYSGDPATLKRSEGAMVHFREAVAEPQVMIDYASRFVPAALEILGGRDAI